MLVWTIKSRISLECNWNFHTQKHQISPAFCSLEVLNALCNAASLSWISCRQAAGMSLLEFSVRVRSADWSGRLESECASLPPVNLDARDSCISCISFSMPSTLQKKAKVETCMVILCGPTLYICNNNYSLFKCSMLKFYVYVAIWLNRRTTGYKKLPCTSRMSLIGIIQSLLGMVPILAIVNLLLIWDNTLLSWDIFLDHMGWDIIFTIESRNSKNYDYQYLRKQKSVKLVITSYIPAEKSYQCSNFRYGE